MKLSAPDYLMTRSAHRTRLEARTQPCRGSPLGLVDRLARYPTKVVLGQKCPTGLSGRQFAYRASSVAWLKLQRSDCRQYCGNTVRPDRNFARTGRSGDAAKAFERSTPVKR